MIAPKHIRILSFSLLFALLSLPLSQEKEGDAQELFSKLSEKVFDQGPKEKSITMEDDPSLKKLGEDLLQLLVERNASAYLDSSVVSSDVLAHAFGYDEVDAPAIRTYIITTLKRSVESVLDMASKLAIPDEEGIFQVKSIEVGNLIKNTSDSDVLTGTKIEIQFTLTPEAISKLDRKYHGEYALFVYSALRSVDGWGLMGDDQIRWVNLPDALLGEEGTATFRAENYLKKHGTLMPGTAAPEFTFYSLEEGAEFDSKVELKGKVVVLEFWATGCGPCQAPMAKLQTYVEQNPGWKDKVEVLTLSIDSTAAKALAHLRKNGWTSTRNVWSGPGEWNASAPSAYKVKGIPVTYLIGTDGDDRQCWTSSEPWIYLLWSRNS